MSAYTDAVERGLKGLEAVSTGVCPGCPECMEAHGFEDSEDFEAAWNCGEVYDEPHFSWGSCGICGTGLGGNREVWHALDTNGEIMHFDDACGDCVCFLANGDEPQDWR